MKSTSCTKKKMPNERLNVAVNWTYLREIWSKQCKNIFFYHQTGTCPVLTTHFRKNFRPAAMQLMDIYWYSLITNLDVH